MPRRSPMSRLTLREVSAAGDHRFQMALRRGAVAEFFSPTAEQARLMAERQHWLNAAAQTYSACLPAGAPLVEESAELAVTWRSISAEEHQTIAALPTPSERCVQLGTIWEPDFLLLQP